MTDSAKLNQAQQTAAGHLAGPLLVIAGAGAGKTRTIVYRILALINAGVDPAKILAVTFTNKAAREMAERISELLAATRPAPWGDGAGPTVCTFHALGVRLLRQHGSTLGLNKNFTILDKEDSLAILKEALTEVGIDRERFEPKKILAIISRQKGQGLDLADYEDSAGQEFYPRTVARAWAAYEKLLTKRQALDFDDLILKPVKLLERQPAVKQWCHEQFQYLHIDEYQDTNAAQYRLAKLLAERQRELCVVGDVDQSIYSWRGADFRNLLRFQKDYPEAKVVWLEENYRSTPIILAAANAVIGKNRERLPKTLFTRRTGGDKIRLTVNFSETEEAETIVTEITRLIRAAGVPPAAIAVLYRANFQSRVLEEACLRADLPYQVLGVRFLERKEIKDVLAFLKVAVNPADIESLKRVVNLPPRGIGKATLAKMVTGETAALPPAAKKKIAAIADLLASLRRAAASQPPSQLIKFTLKTTGLGGWLSSSGEEGLERLENLKELVSLASRYDGRPVTAALEDFLTDTALMANDEAVGEKTGGVKLMTVHAAKGLEFDTVFITGLEQGLFPHERRNENRELNDEEEERRLFYVALTRAERRLYLSYAQTRTLFGSLRANEPSEFLQDIDPKLLDATVTSKVIEF